MYKYGYWNYNSFRNRINREFDNKSNSQYGVRTPLTFLKDTYPKQANESTYEYNKRITRLYYHLKNEVLGKTKQKKRSREEIGYIKQDIASIITQNSDETDEDYKKRIASKYQYLSKRANEKGISINEEINMFEAANRAGTRIYNSQSIFPSSNSKGKEPLRKKIKE